MTLLQNPLIFKQKIILKVDDDVIFGRCLSENLIKINRYIV